jgi:hypothetical protein
MVVRIVRGARLIARTPGCDPTATLQLALEGRRIGERTWRC